jgi:hypothetical protein
MHWLVTWLVVWTISVPCPKAGPPKADPYGRGLIIQEQHYDCHAEKTKHMQKLFATKKEAEEFVSYGKFDAHWNHIRQAYSNADFSELKDFRIEPYCQGGCPKGFDFSKESQETTDELLNADKNDKEGVRFQQKAAKEMSDAFEKIGNCLNTKN